MKKVSVRLLCVLLASAVLACAALAACAPATPEAMLAQAAQSVGNGDFAKAMTLYDKVLSADEDNADAYFGSARAFELRGQPQDALKMIEAGLKKTPDRADEFASERMMLYKWTSDTQAYTSALADLVAGGSSNKALKTELFSLYMDASSYDEARKLDEKSYIEAIEKLYEKDPSNAKFAGELFAYDLRKGEFDKALTLLETLDPDWQTAISKDLNVTLNGLIEEDAANMGAFAQALLGESPDSLLGNMLYVQCLLAQDRRDEAYTYLSAQKKFAAHTPKGSDVLYFGQYGDDGKPSGLGVSVYLLYDQYVFAYFGDWKNGLREGNGTWICDDSVCDFIGEWANDKPNGTGKQLWDGASIEGTYRDGLADGRMRYLLSDDYGDHEYNYTASKGMMQDTIKDQAGNTWACKCELCDRYLYLGGPHGVYGFYDSSLTYEYYLDRKGKEVPVK